MKNTKQIQKLKPKEQKLKELSKPSLKRKPSLDIDDFIERFGKVCGLKPRDKK